VKGVHVADVIIVDFDVLVNKYYLNDGMEEVVVVVDEGRGGGSRNI